MRVGLSWEFDQSRPPADAWAAVMAEIEAADALGYDSAWVHESRGDAASCPAPAIFLTAAARRANNLLLRITGRTVNHCHPVRLAEEVAVLDLYSRGRAGVAFAAAARQGVPEDHLHETIEFVQAAWSLAEFRYRGEHLRFPAHTPAEAPPGVSEPPPAEDYLPQWEWGPATPDFLAITPKPFNPHPPVFIEITGEGTLAWAARHGISPFIPAEVPHERALALLATYRQRLAAAGRSPAEVEPVLERWIHPGAPGDSLILGGSTRDLVVRLRAARVRAGVSHLVWRRTPAQTGRRDQLSQFQSEVQLLLMA